MQSPEEYFEEAKGKSDEALAKLSKQTIEWAEKENSKSPTLVELALRASVLRCAPGLVQAWRDVEGMSIGGTLGSQLQSLAHACDSCRLEDLLEKEADIDVVAKKIAEKSHRTFWAAYQLAKTYEEMSGVALGGNLGAWFDCLLHFVREYETAKHDRPSKDE